MDTKTEKLCFDEISHLICDTDAQVISAIYSIIATDEFIGL